jgi:hypothetical protein
MKLNTLKKAFRKDPPTTDPKWYLSNLRKVSQKEQSCSVYHCVARPERTKLTGLVEIYMYL